MNQSIRKKEKNLTTVIAHVLVEIGEEGIVFACLEQSGHGGVDGVLVLFKPAGHRIADRARIMVQVKVSLGLALAQLGLAKVGMLAQVIVVQLFLEGFVGGLGHNTLLLEDGEDAH